MRRFLLFVLLVICLSACQALAATPTPEPLALIDPATSAPRPTWPPTWTPTARWTPTATATPRPTVTPVRPTVTATPVEIQQPNWSAAIKLRPTKRPAANPPKATITVLATAASTRTVELRVFAIGDSVMLGAARELQKTIPGLEVDAAVSRHVGAALTILQARRAAGRLGQVVVVHIGDNGYLTAKQFDDLMQPLIDLPRVVVVNLKVPRKWEAPNNQVIADGVARYPNTVLLDWHTFGVDHPELFAKDGIHIGAAGAKAYTALVMALLNAVVGPTDRPVDQP